MVCVLLGTIQEKKFKHLIAFAKAYNSYLNALFVLALCLSFRQGKWKRRLETT